MLLHPASCLFSASPTCFLLADDLVSIVLQVVSLSSNCKSDIPNNAGLFPGITKNLQVFVYALVFLISFICLIEELFYCKLSIHVTAFYTSSCSFDILGNKP